MRINYLERLKRYAGVAVPVTISLLLTGCGDRKTVSAQDCVDSNVLAPLVGPTVCGVEPRGTDNIHCTHGVADTPEGRKGYASVCCFEEGGLVVWPYEDGSLKATDCVQDRCYFEEATKK